MVEFLATLDQLFQSWYDKWKKTTSQLDATLSVKAPEVLHSESLRDLMYDDANMTRSEFYFGLLQLLHIFSDTINRNLDDLKGLQRDWKTGSSRP